MPIQRSPKGTIARVNKLIHYVANEAPLDRFSATYQTMCGQWFRHACLRYKAHVNCFQCLTKEHTYRG